MKGRTVVLLVLVGFLSFLSGGWLLHRTQQENGSIYRKARLFDEILTQVATNYVDSLDERRLYDLAVDGMLAKLGDPYSTMLREQEIRDLALSTTGNYGGVGIQIDVRDGWIVVVAPLPETPAEDAGIRSGDRIVGVNDSSTHGWGNERALRELRGEPGTKVKLTVARPGMEAPLTFPLSRARIHVRSVQNATLIRPTIGYVALTTVSEASTVELSQAFERLRQQGARAMILDLRNNVGGLFEVSIAISDLFLERGKSVVETRGRYPGVNRTHRASTPDMFAGMPIAVLVNGGTASAAEIIAGALQDHDRALIVGSTSYGKGLVQTVFPLSAGEHLKLTTARWYTPSGRSIQALRRPGTPVAGASPDSQSAPPDTQRFRSSGGRVIQGGGGIHPDLTILDSLSTAEREFAKALGAQLPAYRDVLTGYAIDLKASGSVTQPDFAVSPAMRAELLRRLRARGVTLTDAIWEGAANLVEQQFGYELARYAFDRSTEFRRQAKDDKQIQRLLSLLEASRTQAELFTNAGRAPESIRRP